MKNLWQNDTFLKISSIVIAFLCWVYIIFITNPEIEVKLSGIPVTLSGHHAIKSEGYIVANELNTTVDIKVKGTRQMLANLNRDSIIASVDLSDCTDKKTYELPIDIKLPYQDITLTSKSIETVSIDVDNYKTQKFAVSYSHEGKLKNSNYSIEETKLDTETVTVAGPETILKTIEKATITIDIDGKNSDISGIASVVLLNSNNTEISTHNLDITDKDISYKCTVFEQKNVKVQPSVNNDTGDYEFTITDHPTITLIGPASDVDAITAIKTRPFTINDNTENYNVRLIIPENITVEEDISTVNILVKKK